MYGRWKGAAKPDKARFFTIYAGVWIGILCLVGVSLYAWFKTNPLAEAVITGHFNNLEPTEALWSREALFIRRIYRQGGRVDYEFRLISPRRMSEGARVRFPFGQDSSQEQNLKEYSLPIRSSFYDSPVQLLYERREKKLLLVHGDKKEELRPIEEESGVRPVRAHLLLRVAYAAGEFRREDFVKRLESNDPIIRRDARDELASLGAVALPWIQQVVVSSDSSYRLLLGVVGALGRMKDPAAGALPPRPRAAIVNLSAHGDAALRGEARRYVRAFPSSSLVTTFEGVLAGARRESNSHPRVGYLAVAGLDLFYDLGIVEKDKYGSRRGDDRGRIALAFEAFSKGWTLKNLARLEDRVLFPKALYGWGLALHDRSWIEGNRGRNPAFVKAAQDKFAEFLREVRSGDRKAYPWPRHNQAGRGVHSQPRTQEPAAEVGESMTSTGSGKADSVAA